MYTRPSITVKQAFLHYSERLGHKSVKLTLDEYTDVLPAMQHLAADRLETKLLRTHLTPSECVRTMYGDDTQLFIDARDKLD